MQGVICHRNLVGQYDGTYQGDLAQDHRWGSCTLSGLSIRSQAQKNMSRICTSVMMSVVTSAMLKLVILDTGCERGRKSRASKCRDELRLEIDAGQNVQLIAVIGRIAIITTGIKVILHKLVQMPILGLIRLTS